MILVAAKMLNAKETRNLPDEPSRGTYLSFSKGLLRKQAKKLLKHRTPPLPEHERDKSAQTSSGKMVTDAMPWWQDEVEKLCEDIKNSEELSETVRLAKEIHDALTNPPAIEPREAGDKFQVYWREITFGKVRYDLYLEYLTLLAAYLALIQNQNPDWATPRFWDVHGELQMEVAFILDAVLQREYSRLDWYTEWHEDYEESKSQDMARIEKYKPEIVAELRRVAEWLKTKKGREEQAQGWEYKASQVEDPHIIWRNIVSQMLTHVKQQRGWDIFDGEYNRKTQRFFELASEINEVYNHYRVIELPLAEDESPRECALRKDETSRLRPLLAQIFLEAYEIVRQQRRGEVKDR
jgi:hypothetical protein